MSYLKIKQTAFGNIDINDSEKEIIHITMTGESRTNIIIIQRENLQEFINQLENCL